MLDPSNQPWTQLANGSLFYNSIPARSIGTFVCGATVRGTSNIIYSRTANVQAACEFMIPLVNCYNIRVVSNLGKNKRERQNTLFRATLRGHKMEGSIEKSLQLTLVKVAFIIITSWFNVVVDGICLPV